LDIQLKKVDYTHEQQAGDLVRLLNDYAQDAMGGGSALKTEVQAGLAQALAQLPHAFSFICYVDDKPAGLVNCFTGFSTFKCMPLVNIHDLAVSKDFRGLGLSQKLLNAVEEEAKLRGCCKVTLEVLSANEVAKNAYVKYGFSGYELIPEAGQAMFWEKSLLS
jgi:ribosomal protein S18 acetylase RimI-like enzyme